MSQLHIIKASAGSGKTFSLTREFLRIVLSEPLDYYRHILAVTFTNKATSEMKSRILLELYKLGTNKESYHLSGLLEFFPNKTEQQIRDKSNAILKQILHGYSWFKIETIDSFFQGVIRSFIREIGIPGNYNIEIDQDKILEEAVDNFLDNLGTNNQILGWVLEYIESKIEEGRSWTIKAELQQLGRHLFIEKIIDKSEYLEQFLGNEEVLKAFRDVLMAQVKSYEQQICVSAQKALSIINNAGLVEGDFFQGPRGPYGFFVKNANGNLTDPNSYVIKVLEQPEKWASGKTKRKTEVQKTGELKLNPIIESIIDFTTVEGAGYYAAKLTLRNYHILGLLYVLRNEINNVKREKGIMLISDAAPFIRKIINGNDIPFIYEKIGTQFNHLLIDEFQDTSRMQWDNFKPLLSNSLSGNNKCLIVGDVKQSIYRWRNSDWEILARKVKENFKQEPIFEEELDTNRRSNAKVIRFNNIFFRDSIHIIDSLTDNKPDNLVPVSEIYKNVTQKVPDQQSQNEGFVCFKFFEERYAKETEDYFSEELIQRINEVLEHNYMPGDITLLVRTKSEGSLLAHFLVEANKEKRFIQDVGVISNESLFLIHSPVIKLLVAAMKFVHTPKEQIIAAELLSSYLQINDPAGGSVVFPSGEFSVEFVDMIIGHGFTTQIADLKLRGLYNITESLCSLLNLNSQSDELVYLHSFFDVVFEYSTKETADLAGFLKYWEDEGNTKTISAAETRGSLKILTIHKSKGLQFPVVIIPYANWKFTPKNNEILWVEPETEPFNKLPLIPVNNCEMMSRSLFKTDYFNENYLSLIDNLNLLYVAFTRAEDALICFAVKSDNQMKTIGDIVFKTVETMASVGELIFNIDNNDLRYILGTLTSKHGTKPGSDINIAPQVDTKGYFPEVKISSQAKEFMRYQDNGNDAAAMGRIYHALMEKIKTKEDIDMAVRSMQLQGVINQVEAVRMKSKLDLIFQNPVLDEWFSAKYKVLTEVDIIGSSGKVRRPDRVMIKDDQAIVLDYKFGVEEGRDKHKKQVLSYMELVKGMGYTNTKGYIWYVFENDIVEVGHDF